MEDYIKTGEDKNYEYYRGDSEVNSDDGDEEEYMQILNKRNEFNVKIKNIELKIKKRSLNKIMILSNSEPEEQILFSLYKTISKDSKDKLKLKNTNNEIKTIEEKKIDLISNDHLSNESNTPYGNNGTQSILIQTNSVINIPTNNNNIDDNLDNEKVIFGKPDVNLDNIILVGLPREAICAKWFYLLLAMIGIGYVIIFIVGIFNKEIGLKINILSLFIFGLFIFFTGVFGFVKINKRIYDNVLLIIFTFISLFSGISAAVLVKINEKTEKYFIVCLIFGIICSIISLICIFLLNKLRKNFVASRTKKLERLM